ncbi:hypothetical protein JL721_12577 [Aureococcus anophagefferens]|nr:hypothetical protein JL721_12577 [Aureococcus anophagefferens]
MRCAWAFVGRRQIAATPRRSLRSQATGDDWFSPAQRAALPTVDASQWARLEAAARHLFDWNAKVNVVSRKDLTGASSSSSTTCRRSRCSTPGLPPRRAALAADVGTGGGFPGLPLAICRPELDFTLCDSRRKKVDVVASCADVAGCGNVAPVAGRAQDIAGDHDLVLGRSVKNLPDFFRTVAPALARGAPARRRSGVLYIKGGDIADELDELGGAVAPAATRAIEAARRRRRDGRAHDGARHDGGAAALAAAATASAVSLASFDLDVASGLLTLSFDATVQSATLNISAVALQSNLTSAEERYRLTGITEDVFPASNSSSVVSVAMAEDDLLAVLFRRHLAVSEESTWLTLQPDSIRAVSGALADGQLRPVKVDDFTADDMQPSLEAFVFDMDAETLHFRFSEPVNRSTLDLSTVVLQTASNQNDAEASLSLVNAGASLLPMPCHDVYTTTAAPTTAAPSSAPTYMTGAPSMTESPSYVPSLAPTYDTPVPTLNGTGHWDVCANYTPVYDSLWINVSMGATNANAIKSAYPLGSQESLTYLALSDALAEDLAGNGALTQFWSIYEGQQAVEWTGDVTPPELVSFALDMDEGLLDLTFSETVNAYQFDVTCVGLQERTDNRTGGLSHDLWGTPYRGTLVTSDDAATLTLTLSADDLNEIKRVSRLAVDAATTNVYVEGTECYRDNAWPANYGIRTLPTNALGVETYVPDTTRPKLVSGSLDLDARS